MANIFPEKKQLSPWKLAQLAQEQALGPDEERQIEQLRQQLDEKFTKMGVQTLYTKPSGLEAALKRDYTNTSTASGMDPQSILDQYWFAKNQNIQDMGEDQRKRFEQQMWEERKKQQEKYSPASFGDFKWMNVDPYKPSSGLEQDLKNMYGVDLANPNSSETVVTPVTVRPSKPVSEIKPDSEIVHKRKFKLD